MKIDNQEKFDTNKDELVWSRIITIYPLMANNNKSIHIVKYYKTKSDEEYYIFKYITADNNGLKIDNFDGFHWSEIIKQINLSDYCYIYSQLGEDKEHFRFVTSGKIIKKYIQEYRRTYEKEECTRIYVLAHH